ncbi:glycosyltransferase [Actinomadura rubteroloni]|uniref:glycosyltransferase n=1 Tax=Actinomadura rubteroloni TaxID=1926885 RepID=UPI00143CE3A9|nr:glycosyltransferase [Actinomadura rubteroloni]
MRVLHVAQPTVGGVAAYVAAAVADQAARGFEVTVACPDGPLADHVGDAHRLWPARRSPTRSVWREVRALRRVVDEVTPDVVHLHSSKAGLAGRLAGLDATVLFQPHGWSWYPAQGMCSVAALLWERRAARRADRIICVGDGELERGRAAGVDARYAVIRNGVDLKRFAVAGDAERAAARRALGVRGGPLALCLGRVTPQKGQDVLLSAWPRVVARRPDARLALVGDGTPDRKVPRGVLTVPAVADPRPWLVAADVVVLPSRWEGLPFVALEAMATGRSVVASDVPGLAEVVTPDVGALVPPEDPRSLAAALAERLADDCPRTAAEGVAAARAATAYDADVTYAALAALTLDVAGFGAPPVK